MTLQDIIDYVNFIIRKSQAGETMTPEQFNTLIKGFNLQVFRSELDTVEVMAKEQRRDLYRVLQTYTPLLRYVKTSQVNTSGGVATKPADYVHWVSVMVRYNGRMRLVEVISHEEMGNRRSSMIDSPLSIKPALVITGASVYVFPKDVGAITDGGLEFTYLRMPAQPVYDYCFHQSTGKYYYMPVGSFIKTVGGVNNLYYFNTPTPAVLDVMHPGKQSGLDYTSKTVELDWDERYHPVFIDQLLRAAIPSYQPEQLPNAVAK